MNNNKKFLFVLFIVCISSISFSQLRDREEESKSSPKKTSQSTATPALSVIMDGPVDPKEYIVGPGDIFMVSIWSAVPLNFQVAVTPEGTMVIPSVNEVVVSGLSLEETKKTVITEIKKKYLSGTASISLAQPRHFTVTVRGVVLNEQTLVVQASNRVETVLRTANDIETYKAKIINVEQTRLNAEKVDKILSTSSKRNIRIIHKDGTTGTADIEKYIATRNITYNPLLHDGDVIIVPPNELEQRFIGVYGAVTKEGTYEFVEGDSLLNLIAIAGGITKNADMEYVTVSRIDALGISSEMLINLAKIVSHEGADIVLQRGDRILVPQKKALDRAGVISVEGEVMTPGTYSIIQDSTKLSEVIKKTGGLTKYALLNGAVLYRGKVKEEEHEIDYLRMRKGLTTSEDTLYFSNETALKNKIGIVSVDFISLLEKSDLSKDVTLFDGDRIVIPAKTNSVYVFGEVKFPGYIRFTKGKDVNYYIATAGGQTEFAEGGDIMIIKAGSKQWLSVKETTIEEGDYVWIPKQPYRPFGYYLGIYSQVFGIVATTISLVLLVTR